MNRPLLLALLISLGLSACSSKEEATATSAEAPKAEAPKMAAAEPKPAAAPPAAEAPASYPPNTGKLVQVMQAGGYTYGEVEGPQGQRIWIAGGHIEADVGDMVQWGQYAVMHNFNAKSINRTFDNILFVNSWGRVGGPKAEVLAHGAAPGGHPAAGPHGGGAAPAAAATGGRTGVVKSSTTAGGYTYLEVEQGGQTLWIAAPETAVKVGDTVGWTGGMTMRNFTAKSLDRTFDEIVFAGGVSVVQ